MRRTWPLINQDISRAPSHCLSSSVLLPPPARRPWEFLIRISSRFFFLPLSGWKPLSWASISRESSLAAIFFNYRFFHNTRALHQSSNKYDHPFLAYVASREKVKDVCHFLLDRLNVTLRILAEPLPMLEYEIEKSRGGIKQDGCEMGPFIRIRRGSRMAHSAKLIKKYTR